MKLKRLLAASISSALLLSICACDNASSDSASTSKSSMNESSSSTIVESEIEETTSGYKPTVGDSLPEIRIVSETGKNDFVTKPVSYAVKEAKKGWITNPLDPQLLAPNPYYEASQITVKDDTGAVLLDNVSGQVKVRGNWTTDYEKKPLRIKFDSKQSMLGLNDNLKAKSWVLLASYKDWSLLRDSVGLYLSKLVSDRYSSDFRLTDVYVNNEYFGVYLLAEQQQVGKCRVDVNSPEKNYTGNDIGYLMEFDGYAQYEDFHFYMNYNHSLADVNGKSTTGLQSGYTIKSDIYSSAQVDFINDYMNSLFELCYKAVYDNDYMEFNSNYELIHSSKSSAYECVSAVLDVDSLVEQYIIQDIVCDPDLYWSSFYMDIDLSEGGNKLLTFEAPWDFDSSLGNKYNLNNAIGQYAGVIGMDVNKTYECANPWMLLFANCDWFKALVNEKWKSVYSSFSNVYSYIEKVESKLESKLNNNFTAWPNTRNHSGVLNELSDQAKACKTQKASSAYLENWLKARISYLNTIYGK